MTNLFLEILNMSISASWLILVVIVLRFLLRKAPKSLQFLLWILVAVKLICPYTFESAFSLIPSLHTFSMYSGSQNMVDSGFKTIDNVLNPYVIKEVTLLDTSLSVMQIVVFVFTIVWIIGVASMLIYSILSYEKLQRKTQISMHLKENIYMCDHIQSPFILGVVKPCIYIPSNMDYRYMNAVLAHEYTHIHRKDHIWKMIGYLLLSFHWFNPIVWIAFILFTYDMEISCDEITIQSMNGQERKEYCSALVSLSAKNHLMFTYPLAFGEIGVKERVKQIVSYKKASIMIAIVAVILCAITIVGFMSGPLSYDIKITDGQEVYKYDIEELNFIYQNNLFTKNEDGREESCYGKTIWLWKIYDKMGIHTFLGPDKADFKSVTIVSDGGVEYEVSDANIYNGILLVEKDESLTFFHKDDENPYKLLKRVKNVKEIVLNK